MNLWTQYVEIIYMPESEIHVLSTIEKMDARPDESSYGFQTQEADIKRRINTLFGSKDEEEKKAETKEDNYETVNEGMTSDTTEAPAHQAKRTAVQEEEEKAIENNKEEEGIQSSDEENQVTHPHISTNPTGFTE